MKAKHHHSLTSLLILPALLLSSCVFPSPINRKEQSLRNPVVVSLMGNEVRVQKIGATAFNAGFHLAQTPEWRLDDLLEDAAVLSLKRRGITARPAGVELRRRFWDLTVSKLSGIDSPDEAPLDDAVRQLAVPGADSVLFLTPGLEPLPTGGVTLMNGPGMCEVSALGFGTTYVCAPVRGWAFANPDGKRLGYSVSRGTMKTMVPAQMPFVGSWDAMPAIQKAALRAEVESVARVSLEHALTKLGL